LGIPTHPEERQKINHHELKYKISHKEEILAGEGRSIRAPFTIFKAGLVSKTETIAFPRINNIRFWFLIPALVG
jgi:hypothetical protein